MGLQALRHRDAGQLTNTDRGPADAPGPTQGETNMSRSEIPFVWRAEAIIDRGPIDEPLFVVAKYEAKISPPCAGGIIEYTHLDVESNAVTVLAKSHHVAPSAVTVLTMHWTEMPDVQVP